MANYEKSYQMLNSAEKHALLQMPLSVGKIQEDAMLLTRDIGFSNAYSFTTAHESVPNNPKTRRTWICITTGRGC